jgi:hypothetical protein
VNTVTFRTDFDRVADDVWSWTMSDPAPDVGNVRLAEWDGDGNCLAVTSSGIYFWNGESWRPVAGTLDLAAVRFVRFVGLGRWLIGARDVWLYASGELSLLWTHPKLSFDQFDGTLDIGLAGGRNQRGAAVVRAHVQGRWLEALKLRDLAQVATISRVDGDRWLVTGQTVGGESYAALVEPLTQRMKRLGSPNVRAFVASAGLPRLGVGCAVGFGGALLCDRVASAVESVDDPFAVAIDSAGRVVVASAGRIWRRRGAPNPVWQAIWRNPDAREPIVALATGTRAIRALTADAAILEGRCLPDLGDEDDVVTRPRATTKEVTMKL